MNSQSWWPVGGGLALSTLVAVGLWQRPPLPWGVQHPLPVSSAPVGQADRVMVHKRGRATSAAPTSLVALRDEGTQAVWDDVPVGTPIDTLPWGRKTGTWCKTLNGWPLFFGGRADRFGAENF